MGYYDDGNNCYDRGININSVNGKANAGLTTAIVAAVLSFLNLGNVGGAINHLIGCGCASNRGEAEALIAQIKAQAEISELKAKDYTDKTAQTLFNQIYAENKELSGYLCAERNRTTALEGRIETDKAKAEVERLKAQIEQERAFFAFKSETDKRLCALENAIAVERDARECGDNAIVGYTNATFYPKQVADVTTGTTTTAQVTYSPLRCSCGCGCHR
jgi:hypothetical protein